MDSCPLSCDRRGVLRCELLIKSSASGRYGPWEWEDISAMMEKWRRVGEWQSAETRAAWGRLVDCVWREETKKRKLHGDLLQAAITQRTDGVYGIPCQIAWDACELIDGRYRVGINMTELHESANWYLRQTCFEKQMESRSSFRSSSAAEA